MEKKQFKAESQRLMDLMINSIYTHKEIFLREIISNASDAIDKLAYRALTDDQVGLNRDDFKIVVVPDKEARTLTVSDNGIGMTQEEMENNLGTIAKSGSLQFKKETEKTDDAEVDIIGQFGVGFYSAFMVADKVTVISKAYGADTAYKWESEGVDGYTIEPCEKDTVGTDVIMSIKPDSEEEKYDEYLEASSIGPVYFFCSVILKIHGAVFNNGCISFCIRSCFAVNSTIRLPPYFFSSLTNAQFGSGSPINRSASVASVTFTVSHRICSSSSRRLMSDGVALSKAKRKVPPLGSFRSEISSWSMVLVAPLRVYKLPIRRSKGNSFCAPSLPLRRTPRERVSSQPRSLCSVRVINTSSGCGSWLKAVNPSTIPDGFICWSGRPWYSP